MSIPWQEIAAKKRQQLADKIPLEWKISIPDSCRDVTSQPTSCGLLDDLDRCITESSFADLVQNLQSGTWTSTQVVTAFAKRASIAQQCTNCLSEILFTEALEVARDLDSYFERTGQTKGPLHGVPISVKVCKAGRIIW